jgi:hypothetical protein
MFRPFWVIVRWFILYGCAEYWSQHLLQCACKYNYLIKIDIHSLSSIQETYCQRLGSHLLVFLAVGACL